MDIVGSVIVVTGAASVLGAATARWLAGAGATVVIADVDDVQGGAIAEETGGSYVATDVTDAGSVENVANVARSLGEVRGLVNSAGGGGPSRRILRGNRDRLSVEQFEAVARLNLTGTFLMTRALAPVIADMPPLDEAGSRGVVVNVSSVAGVVGPAWK